MLSADPTEVADYLQRSGALPRLGGIIVIFVGIGDTTAPQEPLPPGARQRLRDIWEAVVRRAGAADVQFVDTPLTNPPAPDLPPVTVVHIADPPSFAAATVDLTEATVGFRPNTAELRDPVGARQVLAELAARIVRDRVPVTLTGATANFGQLDGQIELGRARAETIRTILVDKLAVPTNLIARVEGVGSAWPGHIPDHDADGKLLPGPAAQNRRVIASFGTPP
jgi:outer membrane protein OmpA-like peptidoglycan-associated protein